MKKNFYDIKGRIKVGNDHVFDLEKLTVLLKNEEGIILEITPTSILFSSNFYEFYKSIFSRRSRNNLPKKLAPVSLGYVNLVKRPDEVLLEYSISLLRLRNFCLFISLAPITAVLNPHKALAVVGIILAIFFALLIYVTTHIGLADEFEKILKSALDSNYKE